jgi:FlaA1/EpsC-like NDP-sugar epimerase
MAKRAARWLIRQRGYVIALAYVFIFALAYELAFQLRFGFDVPGDMRRLFWQTMPWVALLKLCVFYWQGSFHGWWRFVTFADLVSLLRGATLSTLAIVAVDHFLFFADQIPRTALAVDWGFTILLVGGLRSTWRLVAEHGWRNWGDDFRPALMIGAEEGGEALIRQIHRTSRLHYRIVGFLDENRLHHGSRLAGIPFLGSPQDAVPLATQYRVKDILVMARSVSGRRLRELMEECREAGIHLKMIPRVDDLLGSAYTAQVRDVDIDDLLRREPVQLDVEAIGRILRGRRVLVTGAGGSIGAEICRQAAGCRPGQMILLDRAENGLFHLEQELQAQSDGVPIATCVGDIADHGRLESLFREYRPHIVFHAAAHKHVPMMEQNPGEAVKNNVFGTKVLADLASQYGVEQFVLISTDKAVNPSSVMGATKRLAERYVQALQQNSSTRFVTVRFGNVLASAGSVVPTFQQQICRGGPITVTHPDIERFFMTIPESCQLVLQAAAMGSGGEVFVLDMGEPIKIVELARDLIRLSGFAPDEIEIIFSGLRPGEKLSEELYFADEQTTPSSHPKLRQACQPPEELATINEAVAELLPLVDGPAETIRGQLRRLVPEYVPPSGAEELPEAAGDVAAAAVHGKHHDGTVPIAPQQSMR